MNLIRRIAEWFRRPKSNPEFPITREVDGIAEIPDNLDPRAIYVAGTPSRAKWAVFMCPCERPHRITLSLQSSHRPHWRVRVRDGRATIFPSVDARDWRRCH